MLGSTQGHKAIEHRYAPDQVIQVPWPADGGRPQDSFAMWAWNKLLDFAQEYSCRVVLRRRKGAKRRMNRPGTKLIVLGPAGSTRDVLSQAVKLATTSGILDTARLATLRPKEKDEDEVQVQESEGEDESEQKSESDSSMADYDADEPDAPSPADGGDAAAQAEQEAQAGAQQEQKQAAKAEGEAQAAEEEAEAEQEAQAAAAERDPEARQKPEPAPPWPSAEAAPRPRVPRAAAEAPLKRFLLLVVWAAEELEKLCDTKNAKEDGLQATSKELAELAVRQASALWTARDDLQRRFQEIRQQAKAAVALCTACLGRHWQLEVSLPINLVLLAAESLAQADKGGAVVAVAVYVCSFGSDAPQIDFLQYWLAWPILAGLLRLASGGDAAGMEGGSGGGAPPRDGDGGAGGGGAPPRDGAGSGGGEPPATAATAAVVYPPAPAGLSLRSPCRQCRSGAPASARTPLTDTRRPTSPGSACRGTRLSLSTWMRTT